MNFKITFLSYLFEKLKTIISFDGKEKAAFLLCNRIGSKDSIRLLPDNLLIPDKEDYIERAPGYYSLRNEFINRVVNQALVEAKDIIQCHSHPFNPGKYSPIDRRTELEFMRHINDKIDNIYHGSIVFSNDMKTLDSWFYNKEKDGLEASNKINLIYPNQFKLYFPYERRRTIDIPEFQDRTARALGKEALAIFNNLKIGIVGCSGTGSIVAEHLVRLGIKDIVLCDPDILEESNLNRLVSTTGHDIGKYKVKFYRGFLKRIAPDAKIKALPMSFYENKAQEEFTQCDIIFSCVDSGAVHSINHLCMKSLIPLFVLNSGIEVENENISFIGGHILNIIPGSNSCVHCTGIFDELLYEYLDKHTQELEREQGYIKGMNIIEPSVYFLNTAIVSHGIWNFIQYVLGLSENLQFMSYLDLQKNKINTSAANKKECIVCSEKGYLGKGNKIPFLVPDSQFSLEEEMEEYEMQGAG